MTTRRIAAVALIGCAVLWWVGRSSDPLLLAALIITTAAHGLWAIWAVWWIEWTTARRDRVVGWAMRKMGAPDGHP